MKGGPERVVFLGSGAFAVPSLAALLEKMGGDSLSEMLDHLGASRGRWREFLARRPRAAQ